MNAEKPSLTVALKTLWGAAEMPFGDACSEPYRHPSFEDADLPLKRALRHRRQRFATRPKRRGQKLSLRLLYGEAARKTIQNPLAGSLLAHRQRPHTRLVPSTRCPTPDAPQRQRCQYPRCSLPSWAAAGRCWCSKKRRISRPAHSRKCVC